MKLTIKEKEYEKKIKEERAFFLLSFVIILLITIYLTISLSVFELKIMSFLLLLFVIWFFISMYSNIPQNFKKLKLTALEK